MENETGPTEETAKLTQDAAFLDRAMAVVQAAMSLPPEERAAFASAACEGDAALRTEVVRRLTWEERMKGFLSRPIRSVEQLDRPFAIGDELLRRFRIVRLAGEGGMGVVYEAHDGKLGQRVAIKCPRYEFRRRLTPEVIQGLRVMHPNVCRVFALYTAETVFGEVDFLTMEFLEGETLAVRLESAGPGWFASSEGTSVARQVCEGLAAIHAQSVIHRDLKPSNIMLTSDAAGAARAVIMDFGLARGTDMFSSQMRGTPAYLAPEIWAGQPASRQSDLYSLSALLWHMQTGQPPFSPNAPWRERLRAAPSLEGVGKPLPAALVRGLNPDPARRHASVDEFVQALWPRRRWPGRREVLAGLVAVSGAEYLRRTLYPRSPVRLAILPPQVEADGAGQAGLIAGFVHDLANRLRTLRGARRPLMLLTDGTAGATHSLAMHYAGTGLMLTKLTEGAGARLLKQWDDPLGDGLGARLFALHGLLVERLVSLLRLGAEAPRASGLTPAVYETYLRAMRIVREEYDRAGTAIPLFEEVIRAAPTSALAHAGLAEALLNARFVESKPELETPARLALEKAEQLDPNLPQVHLVMGWLELVAGHYERSRNSYRRAADIAPNEPEIYMSMAYPSYMTNRFAEAEALLNQAIALNPSYYKPYIDAGFLAHQRRRFALAEQHWREAIRLAPAGHVAAHYDLAALLVLSGRDAEAESVLDQTAKTRVTPSALQLRGDLRARRGQLAEAIRLYEEAAGLGSPDYRMWSTLGTYYAKAGRPADAEQAFRRGLAATESKLTVNRRQPDALSWLAVYHAKLGNAGPVRTLAAEAHSLAGRDQWTVAKLLAIAFATLGQIGEARELLRNAPQDLHTELALSPDMPSGLR